MGNFAENLNLGNRFRPPLKKVNKIFNITIIGPESSVTGKFNDPCTRAYPAYRVTYVHVSAIRMYACCYFNHVQLDSREGKHGVSSWKKLQRSALDIRFVLITQVYFVILC